MSPQKRQKEKSKPPTTARARTVSKAKPKAPKSSGVDYAAIAGMSDDKVAAKTGRTWSEWVRVLDREGAATLPHREIALLLHGKHHVPGWWAQTVTVGYERIKGLRDRGQRRGGGYEVGRSRTFNVPVKTLFDAWSDAAARRRWLRRSDVTVRTATPPKTIRFQWPDSTIVVVGFSPKGKTKSVVSLAHTKLPNRTAAEEAKSFWSERLDALSSHLGTGTD